MDERILAFLGCGDGRTHTKAFLYRGHLKIGHTFSKALGEGSGSLFPSSDRDRIII